MLIYFFGLTYMDKYLYLASLHVLFNKFGCLFVIVQTLSILNFDSSSFASLNGDNYIDCKEKVLLTLGDLAFRVDKPLKPMNQAFMIRKYYKISYDLWKPSNRLSLMFIKSHIKRCLWIHT
jgi:hypothetical protein